MVQCMTCSAIRECGAMYFSLCATSCIGKTPHINSTLWPSSMSIKLGSGSYPESCASTKFKEVLFFGQADLHHKFPRTTTLRSFRV